VEAFTCARCGEVHDLENISFGASAPAQWDLLSDEQRERSQLWEEQCIIDADGNTSFYLRACLEIPVRGSSRVFVWGVGLAE
jgi:hypothetical protein